VTITHAATDRVRQALRASGFIGVTAAMLPIFVSHQRRVPPEQQDLVRDLWVRRWAATLLRLFAIGVSVQGNVPPPTTKGERGRLIVSNHRSAIDIGVILATFGGTMVSRADIAGWPLIGAAARAVGTVFVDRADAKSGAATIRSIQRQLEAGQTIALFPEGTTFDGDELRPFHGGAFIAATRAGAEVLPVGLAYPAASGAAYFNETFLSHLGRLAKSRSTRMGLAVGPPILTTGMKSATLIERTRTEMTRLSGAARAISGP
jgi:1-acyl-sn-glycerol-3-phosphate acyltransferase